MLKISGSETRDPIFAEQGHILLENFQGEERRLHRFLLRLASDVGAIFSYVCVKTVLIVLETHSVILTSS